MSVRESRYTALFRDEYLTVLRSVFLVVNDRGRAEDITQEAFAKLYAHWRKVSRYDRPDAWVRRVAIRMAIRASGRERRRPSLEIRSQTRPADPPMPDVDLARAVATLAPQQRACVVLHYFEDRPVAEIVDILGIAEPTVRVHLSRARQRLATLMREEVVGDVG
jgi:RNA polymerase sigma-70 factor (ECF subfamily)